MAPAPIVLSGETGVVDGQRVIRAGAEVVLPAGRTLARRRIPAISQTLALLAPAPVGLAPRSSDAHGCVTAGVGVVHVRVHHRDHRVEAGQVHPTGACQPAGFGDPRETTLRAL